MVYKKWLNVACRLVKKECLCLLEDLVGGIEDGDGIFYGRT